MFRFELNVVIAIVRRVVYLDFQHPIDCKRPTAPGDQDQHRSRPPSSWIPPVIPRRKYGELNEQRHAKQPKGPQSGEQANYQENR